ncbi:hypothetical protein [Indioceanicola profundi]|uniref:hypothetical protein n=1 Tax=Indioceanicola profundi TaxID=2220096 RepID=UPI0013C4C7F7|nr:hypothetical protein [Indioceanicola profundi]
MAGLTSINAAATPQANFHIRFMRNLPSIILLIHRVIDRCLSGDISPVAHCHVGLPTVLRQCPYLVRPTILRPEHVFALDLLPLRDDPLAS